MSSEAVETDEGALSTPGSRKRKIARTSAGKREIYASERGLRNVTLFLIIGANLLFLVIPIGIAAYGSLNNWNPLRGTFSFIGLDNYTRLFQDQVFWRSMTNTVIWSVVIIAGRVGLGLLIAYLVWTRSARFKGVFRTIFYLPSVAPLIAVAYVWQMMYHPQIGLINSIFGLDINWLYDSMFAFPAIILMTIWKDFGYAVIFFLAGLYSINTDTLEAADVDGAGPFQKFRHIVIPQLAPMTVFVVITSLFTYMQSYVQIMVMTEGGPGNSTYLASYMIYDEAFVKYDFGYASALAFVLLVLTALITLLMFKSNLSRGSEGSQK